MNNDDSIKPVFKRATSFKGPKKKYQRKVWKAAAKIQPGDELEESFFNKYEERGVAAADIMTAVHFNNRMLTPKPHQLSRRPSV